MASDKTKIECRGCGKMKRFCSCLVRVHACGRCRAPNVCERCGVDKFPEGCDCASRWCNGG